MNHADEIRPLTKMVRPHAVVVTTVGPVHTENFPDGEAGVAKAKAEIFEGLEPGGIAVLNADNNWFEMLKAAAEKAGATVRTFGTGEACDARLIDFQVPGPHAVVQARLHGKAMDFPILQTGFHWGLNSMAVLLMHEALGDLEAEGGRGKRHVLRLPGGGTVTLIDESYNANPASMKAAMALLNATPVAGEGRRIAVLGDRLELGAHSAGLHAGLAELIVGTGTGTVFLGGPEMKALADIVPGEIATEYRAGAKELQPLVLAALKPGDVVMVKSSKGIGFARLVDALLARFPAQSASRKTA
jgi:UDP-N-acetylmuramoyl-tripeptide--D-alanyl-D-alanine ligase